MSDTAVEKSGLGFFGGDNILIWILVFIVLCGGIGPFCNIFHGFGDNTLLIFIVVILLCSGGFPFLGL